MSRSADLNRLSLPVTPLLPSDPRDLARSVAEPTRPTNRPVPIWDDFKLGVSSPAKLREAIVLSEILQPPVALRRRPRM
jgi:hypothetical protein